MIRTTEIKSNKTFIKDLKTLLKKYFNNVSLNEKVKLLNLSRSIISKYSPFITEPVDYVKWVKCDDVKANDYNPNSVAPPEMELLRHSINHDGYTQPVVTWKTEIGIEVIDGFHRRRVCEEFDDVNKRVHGYLPVVNIQNKNTNRTDRIASTIRHNRARGKHAVDSMTDIVIELKRRNWTNKRIGKELGMDTDEILRLCQVSGLKEMFSDKDFSNSWDIDMMSEEDMDFTLDEENIEPDKEVKEGRILHTYDKWECHKAGFYATTDPKNRSTEECENKYVELLTDIPLFKKMLKQIINIWTKSCEHYLTNDSMNRIAWLGQASLCLAYGIPSKYRSGYSKLTPEQQYKADKTALLFLNLWLKRNGYKTLSKSTLKNKPKADIY